MFIFIFLRGNYKALKNENWPSGESDVIGIVSQFFWKSEELRTVETLAGRIKLKLEGLKEECKLTKLKFIQILRLFLKFYFWRK